jgi:hypothetical protein
VPVREIYGGIAKEKESPKSIGKEEEKINNGVFWGGWWDRSIIYLK